MHVLEKRGAITPWIMTVHCVMRRRVARINCDLLNQLSFVRHKSSKFARKSNYVHNLASVWRGSGAWIFLRSNLFNLLPYFLRIVRLDNNCRGKKGCEQKNVTYRFLLDFQRIESEKSVNDEAAKLKRILSDWPLLNIIHNGISISTRAHHSMVRKIIANKTHTKVYWTAFIFRLQCIFIAVVTSVYHIRSLLLLNIAIEYILNMYLLNWHRLKKN